MDIYWKMFRYIRPYIKTILLIMLATILTNAFALLQPLLIRDLLNKVLLDKHIFYLKIIIVGVILLIFFKGIFFYAQGYLTNFVGQSAVKKMREDLFVHIQQLPIRFFDKWKTGEIYSRITNDINVLTNMLSSGIVQFINDMVIIIGSLFWMFYKSWRMTLLTLIVTPLIGAAVMRFGRWMRQVTRYTQSKIADLSSVLYESIAGIRVVKSFGREEYEMKRFRHRNDEYFGFIMKGVQVSFTQTPVVEMLAVLGIAAVVYYGGIEVIRGQFTVGDMFAFWGYMLLATNPLYRISSTYTNLQKAIASAGRVFEVMDIKTETADFPEAIEISHIEGRVEYENIYFSYEKDEWVLQDVNLKVSPGELIALIGPSGAGKTSLVNLLLRFYVPTKGCLKIDGQDIMKLKLASLRSHIGIVPQEVFLFGGTVEENIAYSKPNATHEEVVAAAKTANAHDFIEKLPQKYNTLIGERGVRLSGGQRQRIAIARALLKNPRILILDEATSSLDSESENLIQEALYRLMEGRTTFVIAHRLSTIRRAHRIVAIDDGKIVEVGSHHELLAQGGLYSRIYKAQFQMRDRLEVASFSESGSIGL